MVGLSSEMEVALAARCEGIFAEDRGSRFEAIKSAAEKYFAGEATAETNEATLSSSRAFE